MHGVLREKRTTYPWKRGGAKLVSACTRMRPPSTVRKKTEMLTLIAREVEIRYLLLPADMFILLRLSLQTDINETKNDFL